MTDPVYKGFSSVQSVQVTDLVYIGFSLVQSVQVTDLVYIWFSTECSGDRPCLHMV